MKNYFLIIIVSLFFLFLNSCKEPKINAICACGVSDPARDLPWLAELIEEAKTDNTGNYVGVIWLEDYNRQDVFVTNMMLGSGGLLYHVFNCEGNRVSIEDAVDFFNNLKKNIVIFVNPDNYPLNL